MQSFNLYESQEAMNDDINGVQSFIDEMYANEFAAYFDDVNELYSILKNTDVPISDSQLETILTVLPLDLFTAAETLNKFRLKQEVVKMEIKQKERNTFLSLDKKEYSETIRRAMAQDSVLGDNLLLLAYETIVEQVEKQMTQCRELIMGAKKIWDGRRGTEQSNPIGEVVPDSEESLPEYNPSTRTYIK